MLIPEALADSITLEQLDGVPETLQLAFENLSQENRTESAKAFFSRLFLRFSPKQVLLTYAAKNALQLGFIYRDTLNPPIFSVRVQGIATKTPET
jgi:hypothetical protein